MNKKLRGDDYNSFNVVFSYNPISGFIDDAKESFLYLSSTFHYKYTFFIFYRKRKYEDDVFLPLRIAFYLGLSLLVFAIAFRILIFLEIVD
ncbi:MULTISPECIES: hypothetical protein [unclassified Pseudoalteromonas]|uniref:hypothetical protein n=1 Tax=unclassified Pseudoalteromonas TaxID=194690 RepID=UPI0016022BE6|nr:MULTISPECIES: hypothetical protein [unclassified Pseudoalteromonas]MBB1301445.1 hypothetical protein [Pseudoalteromonas sp. SR44-8]MBB1310756.1 hypothetical protein [Pseudoalteromonas sp. SR41-8]MBB1408282.1 hypothetical protein [Pseudoalteromonas sp. SG44-17]